MSAVSRYFAAEYIVHVQRKVQGSRGDIIDWSDHNLSLSQMENICKQQINLYYYQHLGDAEICQPLLINIEY